VPGETDHRPIGCSTLVNSPPGWRELSMPSLRLRGQPHRQPRQLDARRIRLPRMREARDDHDHRWRHGSERESASRPAPARLLRLQGGDSDLVGRGTFARRPHGALNQADSRDEAGRCQPAVSTSSTVSSSSILASVADTRPPGRQLARRAALSVRAPDQISAPQRAREFEAS
jgi:hypothetical protein